MSRLRVLFISNLFPTPSEPTRGVFKLQLVAALQAACDVSVLCPLPWFPRLPLLRRFKKWYLFAEVPRCYEWQGVEVVSPKYLWFPGLARRYHAELMFQGLKGTAIALHRRNRFDIVHSHWLYPDGVAAQRVAEILEVPHVPTGCGSDVNNVEKDARADTTTMQMLGNAAHIVTVSRRMKERLVGRGISPDRVTAIANGVNLELFQPMDEPKGRSAARPDSSVNRVLFVGRLSREKGVDVLIQAVAAVRKKLNIRLTIVGDGVLRDELERQVRALMLESSVIFVGHVAHTSVRRWMTEADCLCLPSLHEGCPNVILEALACGLPVVSSDVGAVSEFVNDTNGVLATPGEPKELAEGLCKVLVRSWDRKAIRDSVRKHTWEETARRYIGVFDQSINQVLDSAGGLQCAR